MTGYAAQVEEAEAKLANVEAKLEEIEVFKALEPKLRREAAGLATKITELKEAAEAAKSEKAFFEEEEEAPSPVASAKQAPAVPRDAEGDRKAKMKAINKKLKQIDLLKAKDSLDDAARAKVASEPKLQKQLAALEAGEEYLDSDAEVEPEQPTTNFKQVEPEPVVGTSEAGSESVLKLPTDPAEVEKRVKTLKKKLQQIAKLKEKGGVLDEEAKQKIAGQDRIQQEVTALEAGKDEVVFVAKDPKVELEKQLKAVNKKLEQIKKLKEGANLDADAQAKVASEPALKKESGHLSYQLGELNKQERERVAQRLGWEAEQKDAKKAGGKK